MSDGTQPMSVDKVKKTPVPALSFKIGEVPNFPFVNNSFEVAIHLIDNASGGCKAVDGKLEVNLKLYFQEKPLRQCPSEILHIKDPVYIEKSGTVKTIITLKELSMGYENKSFVLQASSEPLKGQYITPALSDPMLSIKYRLVIQSALNIPSVWYKDEGGRDKCIDVALHLLDDSGGIVTNKKVPLNVVLLYDGGHAVQNQDVLKISPDNKLYVDDTGKAQLHLRIDDVSKNHQKQAFIIKVGPDTKNYPLNSDISPDQCVPIEVRSKRNKRAREKEMMSPNSGAGGNNAGGGAPPSQYHRTSYSVDINAPSTHIAQSGGLARTPLAAAVAAAVPSDNHVRFQQPTNCSEYLQHIYNWVNMALNGFRQIEWVQTGYERPDKKPLYEMANPNDILAELFAMYNDGVLNSFQQLAQHVDNCATANVAVAAVAAAAGTATIDGATGIIRPSTPGSTSSTVPATSSTNNGQVAGTTDAGGGQDSDDEMPDSILPLISTSSFLNEPTPQMSTKAVSGSNGTSATASTDPKSSSFSYDTNTNTTNSNSTDNSSTIANNTNSSNNSSNMNLNMNMSAVVPPTYTQMPSWGPTSSWSDMPKLSKEDSQTFSWSMPSANLVPATDTDVDAFYILAKRYVVDEIEIGLPAFDREHNLVCFYQGMNEYGVTVPKCIPLKNFKFSTDVTVNASNVFKEHLNRNDSCILKLNYDNSVLHTTVIENALIYALDHPDPIRFTQS